MKAASTPLAQSLTPILEAAATWLNGLIPPNFHRITNRAILHWTFTPKGASSAIPEAWKLPWGEMSAHEALAYTHQEQGFRAQAHAVLLAQGALGTGLQTIGVELMQAAKGVHVLIRIGGQPLGGTEKGMTIPSCLARLDRALVLLRHIPMDASAPLHPYEVEAYPVDAPDPRSAIALHLIARDPDRLVRMLTQGPIAGPGYAIKVVRVETTTGEEVFADLVLPKKRQSSPA